MAKYTQVTSDDDWDRDDDALDDDDLDKNDDDLDEDDEEFDIYDDDLVRGNDDTVNEPPRPRRSHDLWRLRLVVHGLPEKGRENNKQCRKEVVKLFKALSQNITKFVARRDEDTNTMIGGRPIILDFEQEEEREAIWESRWDLIYHKDDEPVLSKFPHALIAKVFPQEVLMRCRESLSIYNHVMQVSKQSNEYPLQLCDDQLVIMGKSYTIYNLHSLPKKFKLTEEASRRAFGKYIFFAGMASPYSNFHPCDFTVDGVSYNCVVQYQTNQMALFAGDLRTAHMIMTTDYPAWQLSISHHISNLSKRDWQNVFLRYMNVGIRAKFQQNPDLKECLMATGDSILAEATEDQFWGIGLGLHSQNIEDENNWSGKNMMGKLLVSLRQKMRRGDADDGSATPADLRITAQGELQQVSIPDDPPYTAFVGGLPDDTDREDITLFFTDCPIKSVRFIRDRQTGKLRGFGFVEFRNKQSLKKALTYDGKAFRNKKLRVNLATPR